MEQAFARLGTERGPGAGQRRSAPYRFALGYPSPYPLAMSSLGYLQIHRLVNERPGWVAERAPLPDRLALARHRATKTPLFTLESQTPVGDFDVLGLSHAYELELTGLAEWLELCGLAPLAADRDHRDPLVVLGGPITFSNPRPSAAFADILLLGEAEKTLDELLDAVERHGGRGDRARRAALLDGLADKPGFYVPSRHRGHLPPIASAPDDRLPARSAIWTEDAELSGMMLIEPERGCHRGCTFCVMRRSTNGGMRLVDPERIAALVPDEAERVGLVGAAVTDHPRIETILSELIEGRGKRIGISSLRADRLTDRIVRLLHLGGYRSLTVALDGASERLRDGLEKNIRARHIESAAAMAAAAGMRHLKLYVIVALPGETDEDRAELIELALRLRQTIPVVLAVSPFIPKFHTPLAEAHFAGEAKVQAILRDLQAKLRGKVEVRGPGAREAAIEARLAVGGPEHGAAAVEVARAGGRLSDWRRALASLPERSLPDDFAALVPPPTRRRAGRS